MDEYSNQLTSKMRYCELMSVWQIRYKFLIYGEPFPQHIRRKTHYYEYDT